MTKSSLIHKHNNSFFKSWHLLALAIPSIIFVLIFSTFATQGTVKESAIKATHPTPTPKINIQLGTTEISATVSDTEYSRQIGLSNHDYLPQDEGMLFIFDQNDVHPISFWMKDMSFPIDILWIDDGVVVQIDSNVQPEEASVPDTDLRLYPSNQPVDYVLELNAGFSELNNIEVGTKVNFDVL